LEEFGRLHDEAVQVIERVAGGAPPSACLRGYAARAAANLRDRSGGREPACGTLLQTITAIAGDFTALGFPVAVRHTGHAAAYEPAVGPRSRVPLTAALTEALNNACKHSGAEGATIRVRVAIRLKELGYQRGIGT
jgi:hypothetical protein